MWDQRFSSDEYIYGTEPNEFLRENAAVIPKGDILCLAEGEGRNAVFLAKQGYRVTAVDISAEGIKKTEKLAGENGVTVNTIVANLADFDPGREKWDGVISIFGHVPPDIRRSLHRRVVDSLKENGVFLSEMYRPYQLNYGTGGPPVVELLVSVEQFREELSGLQFELLREVDREIVEGSLHTGMGAVSQVIGRASRAR